MESAHKSGLKSLSIPYCLFPISLVPAFVHFITSSLLHSSTVHCPLFTAHCLCDPNHGEQEIPHFRGAILSFHSIKPFFLGVWGGRYGEIQEKKCPTQDHAMKKAPCSLLKKWLGGSKVDHHPARMP